MAIRRATRTRNAQIPPGGILQLATGHDFFRSGWGNNPDADAIQEMRSAWKDAEVRRLVQARTGTCHGPSARPFAEFLFGEGRGNRFIGSGEVQAARSAYRQERSMVQPLHSEQNSSSEQ